MQPPSKLLSTTEWRRALSTRQGTFVVAGVVALLAGAFLLLFLSRYRASVTDSSPVKVLVARALIEKGSSGDVILTTGMVEQATVKKTELRGGAVKEPSALRGKVAADDVYPGEQLTSADLTASTGSLANEITGTERAISLPLDSAHGMIGDLSAGDHVDVFSAFNVDSFGGRPRPVLKAVMRNAIVLKVPDKASGGLGGANKTQDVVLKAPDFQSWKFALTSDYGKLWLVLRPKVGADETTPSPVTVERILFGTPSIPVRRGSR